MTHDILAERKASWARRSGFSLIELITAMLASTVLLASLAATVVISTKLLELPPGDQAVGHDRQIADRLANDLRYANVVNDTVSGAFEITRPDSSGLSPETAIYQFNLDGLTRQVAGGPTMNLDPDPPSHQFWVDGYSAPTYLQSDIYVSLRSTSTATTPSTAASLDIDVPPGCKPGDLVLLCVSAKTPAYLNVSQSGWQGLQTRGIDDLRLVVLYRTYDLAWPPVMTVLASPDSAMAAAMLAFENVDLSSPIDWTGANGGYASSGLSSTHPAPLESSAVDRRQLNVQVFAADHDPWIGGALGMAGFADAVQATAGQADSSTRNSLGIVIRSGAAPDLSATPRLLHQSSGYWLQAAAHLEVAP
jgi:hypothetical protein